MASTPTSSADRSRIFRALLRLLPFDFRVEHGREMEQVFRRSRPRRATRARFGAVARLWFETVHDLLTTAPRQHAAMLRQDIGYTLRTLRRTPGFTAAALLTLAIGISASASIFTIINAFLFRPLPVDRPEELVSIATLGDRHIEMPHGVSFRDLQDYRELTDVFSRAARYQPQGAWFDAGNGIERIVVEAVTENTFSLLGVRPAIGRVLAPADEQSPVVVLAHEYWRGRFNGDPSVVGRTVRMNGEAFTIIGVAAERFCRPRVAAARVRLRAVVDARPHLGRSRRTVRNCSRRGIVTQLGVIGRLKTRRRPRTGPRRAGGQGRRARAPVPGDEHGRRAARRSGNARAAGSAERPDVSRRGGRASRCWPDCCCASRAPTSRTCCWHAPRRAGARWRCARRSARGSGRIVRQLFTESVVLAVLGSAGADRCWRWRPRRPWSTASPAWRSRYRCASISASTGACFGVTLLVAVAAGVIAGLAPALYARRADVNTLLKTGGRREGAERGRLRGLLVVAQIAVSLVLLIVGGLFVRTLERARHADVGFRSDHVLMARVDLSRETYTAARRQGVLS